MSTANAVTTSSGRMSYGMNAEDGFRVGLSGHGDKEINYAELVDFNFSEMVSVTDLEESGGRLKNLYLMLRDLGVARDANNQGVTITIMKMGEVKKRDRKKGGDYCPRPRFIGYSALVEGRSVVAVVGSGVSFYLCKGSVYRSLSAAKRAAKGVQLGVTESKNLGLTRIHSLAVMPEGVK